MKHVVIVDAVRTPIGKFCGAFSGKSAANLGAQAIGALLKRTGVDPASVSDVIMGQVLQAGTGQNPARQAAIAGGIPDSVPAMTINQVCGAGQRSLHLAAQAIKCGDADIVIAGGQDSMTQAPRLLDSTRSGIRLGAVELRDAMIVDGLWDAFNQVHMGDTVEHIARTRQISRREQDAFAARSQAKASAAIAADRFAGEMTPVTVHSAKGDKIISADESPRRDVTAESLAAMRPAFSPDGTITAGNASGLNDGAAALMLMSEDRASALSLEPLGRITSYASAALDPMLMGLGPVLASQKCLARAGWTIGDLDLLEINEAFAAQAIAVDREMGWDPDKVNVNGGAIALGHPLAASGARIVVTLLHEMRRRGAHKGLSSLCIGGGQGVAVCVER